RTVTTKDILQDAEDRIERRLWVLLKDRLSNRNTLLTERVLNVAERDGRTLSPRDICRPRNPRCLCCPAHPASVRRCWHLRPVNLRHLHPTHESTAAVRAEQRRVR